MSTAKHVAVTVVTGWLLGLVLTFIGVCVTSWYVDNADPSMPHDASRGTRGTRSIHLLAQ